MPVILTVLILSQLEYPAELPPENSLEPVQTPSDLNLENIDLVLKVSGRQITSVQMMEDSVPMIHFVHQRTPLDLVSAEWAIRFYNICLVKSL